MEEQIELKIITLNLPQHYLTAIQTLVDKNIYPSRSEAIRSALREFLSKEFSFKEDLSTDSLNHLIKVENYIA